MEPDYTPHDAGNNTKQEGDKFYKTVWVQHPDGRKEEVSADRLYRYSGDMGWRVAEDTMMKHEEVLLDLLEERKDEDNIPY